MTNLEEFQRKVIENFGSREGFLTWQLVQLSISQQPCDVTFYQRRPLLDVRVSPRLGHAIISGIGAKGLAALLNRLPFSDGSTVCTADIWTVNPMPQDGLSEAQLAAVDLSGGEVPVGQNGQTIRQIIRETYQTQTREEEDRFVRRFLAS